MMPLSWPEVSSIHPFAPESLGQAYVYALHMDDSGTLWIGTVARGPRPEEIAVFLQVAEQESISDRDLGKR